MPRIDVRPAGAGDAEAVAAMVGALSAEEGLEPPAFTSGTFLAHACGSDPSLRAFVAVRAEQPVGFCFFSPGFDSQSGRPGLIVEDLYVRPDLRRRGIGRRLLAAVAGESASRGGGWVAWHVRLNNEGALAFYRSLGAIGEPAAVMAVSGPAFNRLRRSA